MSDKNSFHIFHILESEEVSLFINSIYSLYLNADQVLEPLLRMDFSARKNTPFEVNITLTKQSDEVKNLFKEIARVYKRIHKLIFKNLEPLLPKPVLSNDLEMT
ncbi:5634_t:CDS:2 [Funneliformis geosporum]|nr:5634_t:CDS:2 [Funneliformis geosporum]